MGDGGPELEDIDDEDGEGGQDLKKKIEGKNAQVQLSISCVALKLPHMCCKIYTNHVDTACLKYIFFILPPFEIRYQKKISPLKKLKRYLSYIFEYLLLLLVSSKLSNKCVTGVTGVQSQYFET